MRVLYFTRDYTTHDHRFLAALGQTEHQVYYLRLERQPHQIEDRPLPPNIEQVSWSGGLSPASLWSGPRLLGELKQIIRKLKPDLIQAGPLQRSAFLAALSGFQPLISMSWGYDLIHDAQRSAAWRWATRYTLQHSTLMIGDCQTIRRLANSYGMPDERIITFPWGIDLKHFHCAAVHCATQRPQHPPFTILSTRSWEPIYGVDLIAQAFIQVAAQNQPVRLVMLGGGSQAAQLRQMFLRHGLIGAPGIQAAPGEDIPVDTLDKASYPHLIFPGQVGYNDLPRYYQSADLYISASHSDGTSISLLEAMACGCPALVSDIPGNREWIIPGENGWLFPDGNAQALARTIQTAIEQRARLPEMGRKARQVAEDRADWDKNFQELLKAYDLAQRITLPRKLHR